ncbi:phytanoyl-CoA dioxygenase family protein [Myxococcota bacterium]|nr:phytanoyl-CoA dioxygenase family protein [Myxococcota bacterium]
MAAGLETFNADAAPDQVAQALLEHGGVIVEGLLSEESLRRLNEEVEAPLADADPGMSHLNPAVGFFFGKRTRHVAGLASKSRTFATDLLCHPVLTGVCDRVLLPACARYQMNLGHIIDRGPGSEQQLIHRDELVWVHVPRPHPELQVASMTALVDFTSQNGATRLVPGSHRWEYDRTPEDSEIVDAEMAAGSSVIYLGSTLHAGGANETPDVWRRGLHLSYVVGWLRTEENNYLATPPGVARTLPRASQELIGYAVHDAIEDAGGYLGMLGMRDPVELMRDGEL